MRPPGLARADAFYTAHGALPLPPLPAPVAAAAAAAAAAAFAAVAAVAQPSSTTHSSTSLSSPELVDEEGYTRSFRVDEADRILAFYDRYGFVVVRDVLGPADCAATISEIWSIIEARGQLKTKAKPKPKSKAASTSASEAKAVAVSRTNPGSWDPNWAWAAAVGPVSIKEGMVGTGAIFAPQAIKNRYNPAMLRVAQLLLGDDDLIVSHDRYGIFRPTLGHPERATTSNLHLDMNPWRFISLTASEQKARTREERNKPVRSAAKKAAEAMEGSSDEGLARLRGLQYDDIGDFLEENNLPLRQNKPSVQMLINLADNRDEDGGLVVVPQFPSKQFLAWTKAKRQSMLGYSLDDNFIRLYDDDPLQRQAMRVASRAGSLIVWDKRMVHGSHPNQSANFRYAQFFLMAPRSAVALDAQRSKRRRLAVLAGLKSARIDPAALPPHALRLFDIPPATK